MPPQQRPGIPPRTPPTTLLHSRAPLPTPHHDQLQRIIYRADLPSRSEDSSIRSPGELNRRDISTAALGPYVTVIAGHQAYIENAALLSAVQIVGSAARLRDIRQRAYECVRTFRTHLDDTLPERERRLILEDIADELGELELSFSVEATWQDAERGARPRLAMEILAR